MGSVSGNRTKARVFMESTELEMESGPGAISTGSIERE